ncbi:MAG: carboxypeptidase-like regulatory domain-containing protein [Prevotellaceae bacterium]|jgi:uncharacterized membrane protein|nr:carboxypeptidase-like regulatory domain-containing protein [Prevotellaceae bacterium]
MKKLFIIAASLLLSVSAFANEGCHKDKTVQLTGFVADKNNEALAGATISIDGKKLYSDFDGNFSADIKPGKHQIKVELISYETIVLETEVKQNENISIALPQLHTPAQENNLAVIF